MLISKKKQLQNKVDLLQDNMEGIFSAGLSMYAVSAFLHHFASESPMKNKITFMLLIIGTTFLVNAFHKKYTQNGWKKELDSLVEYHKSMYREVNKRHRRTAQNNKRTSGTNVKTLQQVNQKRSSRKNNNGKDNIINFPN